VCCHITDHRRLVDDDRPHDSAGLTSPFLTQKHTWTRRP
jgi:hypothetical protein